ncbi:MULTISPECIES: TIGR01777 family oxidoreductase [Bacillaceae]|uniref:TIGR01777 family oxidoreductase n=1 Tax=Evansella alkalicola TaxID=745819 RepID=A0ABS6JMR7_9BACI|nr:MULTISPECIES: TIGR01777 family oxidoreductase [Bacillaceae]MBU9719858.1 TIGR01777 family oxidoreductase [Bacillus alkalicola]
MKIAIAGGSGFVGKHLTMKLVAEGHQVVILTRNKPHTQHKDITYVEWLTEQAEPEKALTDITAFINLAGENLNSGRWTKAKKQDILQSRIDATKEITRIITKMETKPKILINASAIGYYGTSEESTFTEQTDKSGNDFLANVVKTWEQAANDVPDSVRVVFARFGMILDKDEGALNKMLLPYKLFIGGPLGSGKQWLSWIHIDDLVNAIHFCLMQGEISGPVNMTASEPLRMNDFGKTLGSVLNKPHWAPVPAFLLKIVLGEMSILVVEGQRVLPDKLQEHGFTFQYPNLKPALINILR